MSIAPSVAGSSRSTKMSQKKSEGVTLPLMGEPVAPKCFGLSATKKGLKGFMESFRRSDCLEDKLVFLNDGLLYGRHLNSLLTTHSRSRRDVFTVTKQIDVLLAAVQDFHDDIDQFKLRCRDCDSVLETDVDVSPVSSAPTSEMLSEQSVTNEETE